MWLFPDEASHAPRVMMFGIATVEAPADQISRVVADVMAWDLPFDWNIDEVADALKKGLNSAREGDEDDDNGFFRQFHRFRKQSCRFDRLPGVGCVGGTCSGECRPYKVSDGIGARELCVCI
ncbi:hypothetical protein BH09ACT7_BH09ACT7_55250 [soil metagenome]